MKVGKYLNSQSLSALQHFHILAFRKQNSQYHDVWINKCLDVILFASASSEWIQSSTTKSWCIQISHEFRNDYTHRWVAFLDRILGPFLMSSRLRFVNSANIVRVQKTLCFIPSRVFRHKLWGGTCRYRCAIGTSTTFICFRIGSWSQRISLQAYEWRLGRMGVSDQEFWSIWSSILASFAFNGSFLSQIGHDVTHDVYCQNSRRTSCRFWTHIISQQCDNL